MRVAVIGMSRFVRRRVLPALALCPEVERIDLVSRSTTEACAAEDVPRFGSLFPSVEAALGSSDAELFYVSHVNARHERDASLALEGGRHVVVDKPITTSLEATRRLVDLAGARSLLLAEATIYAFHPALARARQVFAERGTEIDTADAVFTPPVPLHDYRRVSTDGGGALLDLGPYAASIGRVIWSSPGRETVVGFGRRNNESGLETGFSTLTRLAEDCVLSGHFGFETEYTNELRLFGRQLAVTVPRAFSIPPDMEVTITIRASNQNSSIIVPPYDSMLGFLRFVLDSMATHPTAPAATLLEDAVRLDAIRTAVDPAAQTV